MVLHMPLSILKSILHFIRQIEHSKKLIEPGPGPACTGCLNFLWLARPPELLHPNVHRLHLYKNVFCFFCRRCPSSSTTCPRLVSMVVVPRFSPVQFLNSGLVSIAGGPELLAVDTGCKGGASAVDVCGDGEGLWVDLDCDDLCCTAGVSTLATSALATFVRACTAASKLLDESSGSSSGALHRFLTASRCSLYSASLSSPSSRHSLRARRSASSFAIPGALRVMSPSLADYPSPPLVPSEHRHDVPRCR